MNKHVVFNSIAIEDINYAGMYGLWQCRRAPADIKNLIGAQVILKGGSKLLNKGLTQALVADIASVSKVSDGDELSNVVWPSVVNEEDAGKYNVEIGLTNVKTTDWDYLKGKIGEGFRMSMAGFGIYENIIEVN